MRRLRYFLAVLLFGSVAAGLNGQQPLLVVQAANAPTAEATPVKVAPAAEESAVQAATKALLETKKANEDLLKKQEATLQQLDELQKATEQLKIFSKRG